MRARHLHPGGDRRRELTEVELRRLRSLVEHSELSHTDIGLRFRLSKVRLYEIIRAHGMADPRAAKSAPKPKAEKLSRRGIALSIARARKAKHEEAVQTLDQRMAEMRCRWVVGKEFEERARELLERGRAGEARGDVGGVVVSDAADSYFAALAALRLRALIRGERWPEPDEQFDLVLAVAMARLG